MTNGEKLKEIFPDAEISIVKSNYGRTKVAVEWKFEQIPSYYNLFYEDWWNAEYKEPITKNDSPKYCDRNICLKNEYNNVGCEDCEVTKSQEPTTKNDLAVDCIKKSDAINIIQDMHGLARADVISDAVNRIIELPSVTQHSSKLEKNSKKLEKNFGDLDCISRVEVIDYLCKHCPDDGECFKDCDEIKHLRQMPSVTLQPCEDAISRQAVLDLMMQKWGENFSGDDAMQESIDAIRELPSVTPQEPRWIPVSERLPETGDEVLCWYEYYHWSQEKVLPDYGIGCYFKETSAWYGEVAVGRDVRVIAWMPLQPYKAEGSDKE